MKAYWINPETINCFYLYDKEWVALCKALGYDEPQNAICVMPIEINQ